MKVLQKSGQRHRHMLYIGFRDVWRCWYARLGVCRVEGHQPWPYRSGLEMFCRRCHTNLHWNGD